MTKRILLTLFLAVAVCGAASADAIDAAGAAAEKSLTVRTFQFKNKEADKAAAIIKPLMSAEGAVSIQPGSNSLVVTDKAENLRAIADVLKQYDSPPQPVFLSIRLVSATRVPVAKATGIPPELGDVSVNLSMFGFNSFEMLGIASLEGKEGEPGSIELPSGYRADFKFGEYDPASRTVRLSDFRISKKQKDQLTQLWKTSLNLKVGQTVIYGTAKDPQSQRMMIVVMGAKK